MFLYTCVLCLVTYMRPSHLANTSLVVASCVFACGDRAYLNKNRVSMARSVRQEYLFCFCETEHSDKVGTVSAHGTGRKSF